MFIIRVLTLLHYFIVFTFLCEIVYCLLGHRHLYMVWGNEYRGQILLPKVRPRRRDRVLMVGAAALFWDIGVIDIASVRMLLCALRPLHPFLH